MFPGDIWFPADETAPSPVVRACWLLLLEMAPHEARQLQGIGSR